MSLSNPKVLIGLAITLAVIALGFLFKEQSFVYRVPETKLQASLDEKLPLEKTYLKVFAVSLNNPRVDLDKETDRVKGGLDISVTIGALGFSRQFDGTVDASGSVAYVPEEGAFYVKDPAVENLTLPGVPDRYQTQVDAAAARAIEDFYATHPVYRLEGRTSKEKAARMLLKTVDVDGDTLVVTLGLQ